MPSSALFSRGQQKERERERERGREKEEEREGEKALEEQRRSATKGSVRALGERAARAPACWSSGHGGPRREAPGGRDREQARGSGRKARRRARSKLHGLQRIARAGRRAVPAAAVLGGFKAMRGRGTAAAAASSSALAAWCYGGSGRAASAR